MIKIHSFCFHNRNSKCPWCTFTVGSPASVSVFVVESSPVPWLSNTVTKRYLQTECGCTTLFYVSTESILERNFSSIRAPSKCRKARVRPWFCFFSPLCSVKSSDGKSNTSQLGQGSVGLSSCLSNLSSKWLSNSSTQWLCICAGVSMCLSVSGCGRPRLRDAFGEWEKAKVW